MLDWLFRLFLTVAILLMFITIVADLDKFWQTTLLLVDIVLWFLLAASIMEIEIPYQAIQADDTIVTGSHIFSSKISPYLVYFFEMMGFIMIIYFVGYLFGPAFFGKFYPHKNRFRR